MLYVVSTPSPYTKDEVKVSNAAFYCKLLYTACSLKENV